MKGDPFKQWTQELEQAGWKRHDTHSTIWIAPTGVWYRGPYKAWCIMKGIPCVNTPRESNQTLRACESCGSDTNYLCPFCRIFLRQDIPVCEKPECREKHESIGCIRTDSTVTRGLKA